jgi:hypothetical protein
MERENNDDNDEEDDEDIQFNLCECAAQANRWDIVQLAIDFGCTCSDGTQLRLLRQLSGVLKLYSLD